MSILGNVSVDDAVNSSYYQFLKKKVDKRIFSHYTEKYNEGLHLPSHLHPVEIGEALELDHAVTGFGFYICATYPKADVTYARIQNMSIPRIVLTPDHTKKPNSDQRDTLVVFVNEDVDMTAAMSWMVNIRVRDWDYILFIESAKTCRIGKFIDSENLAEVYQKACWHETHRGSSIGSFLRQYQSQ